MLIQYALRTMADCLLVRIKKPRACSRSQRPKRQQELLESEGEMSSPVLARSILLVLLATTSSIAVEIQQYSYSIQSSSSSSSSSGGGSSGGGSSGGGSSGGSSSTSSSSAWQSDSVRLRPQHQCKKSILLFLPADFFWNSNYQLFIYLFTSNKSSCPHQQLRASLREYTRTHRRQATMS